MENDAKEVKCRNQMAMFTDDVGHNKLQINPKVLGQWSIAMTTCTKVSG